MFNRKWCYLFYLCLLPFASCLIQGCSKNNTSHTEEVTVSAAASLKEALETIRPLYEKANPQVTITYNFASSGSLQRQIEQGAPVDIFFPAATQQMDALQNKGLLLQATRQDLLTNRMVLVAPQDNQTIKSFADLTTKSVTKIALGEPKSVPAGTYAQEVINTLQINRTIQPKVIYGKDVRQVLHYVATGNVDGGIVYLTDAKVFPEVKIIAQAPNNSHGAIVYPVAVVKDSPKSEEAKKLLKFLFSSEAKVVFEDYGFEVISNTVDQK